MKDILKGRVIINIILFGGYKCSKTIPVRDE
nr:MAG TPA: hypothetical protein [Caudoviricetes sp.]